MATPPRTGRSLSSNLRNLTAPRTGAILQVFEQRGRARSSPDKAANPADARIQAIRDGGRNDPRHRTGGENQETTIQPQTTNRKSNHRSGNVGRGLGGLKPGKSFARQKHTLNKLCTRTSSRMESQEARIVCERGTIRLFEW